MGSAPSSPGPSPENTAGSGRPRGVWAERFDLIDAWRGLAALAVVVHHVAHVYIGGPAVMLFFVISGYCIAASADSCQRKGLGFGRFMVRRVRRIYPPYLLSLVFWAVTRVIKLFRSGENDLLFSPIDGTPRHALDWLQNATMTQWLSLLVHPLPSAASNRTLFVAAYWSLCYEEQFYLLTGLMLLAAGVMGLSIRTMIAALLAAGLVWNVFFPEICYGLFIEYWAMFGLGALVFYRLCRMPEARHRRMVDAALLVVLAGSVYLRWFAGIAWDVDAPGLTADARAEGRVVYEELAIAAGFGLLLIATRPLNDAIRNRALFRPFAALGQITFSLYLIHQFNLTFAKTIVNQGLVMLGVMMPLGVDQDSPWYSLVLQIGVLIALASVFWYFCERPFLNKSLLPAGVVGGTSPSPAPERTAQ